MFVRGLYLFDSFSIWWIFCSIQFFCIRQNNELDYFYQIPIFISFGVRKRVIKFR